MSDKVIHIVAFDIPYPVDHGGFFDLFYKLVALHEKQIIIYLHCYEYGRKHQSLLNQYCKKVYYYQRKTGFNNLFSGLPYIVASRRSSGLIKRLSADNYPILLEGTHCTYLLYKNCFPTRTILYRLHNIEHIYYKKLFHAEKNVLKRFYFLTESFLLRRYERIVASKATAVLTVSENDRIHFQQYAPLSKIQYLPVFLPQTNVQSKIGSGSYCLYHGNLSVAENEQAAKWLIYNVFHGLKYPLIIAGRKPSGSLSRIIESYEHISLEADPDDLQMQKLIEDAHINIVISFNQTGIKLKLLNALFNGRHCLVNLPAVENTALEDCCVVADSAAQMKEKIIQLYQQHFKEADIAVREAVLKETYNNNQTAQKLIALLY